MCINLSLLNQTFSLKALLPAKLPFHMLLPGFKCKVTVNKVIFYERKISV